MMRSKDLIKALVAAVVLMAVVTVPAVGQQDKVLLNFVTLTANHSALGAPIKWQLAITNTGAVAGSVNWNVVLVAPDATSYNILTQKVKTNPGEIKSVFGQLSTSTFTNQIGTFTLRGFTSKPNGGQIIYETDIPVAVSAVPPNGVYGSVGGQGLPTGLQGRVTDYSTVAANLGTTSMQLRTRVTLLLTDGTPIQLKTSSLTTLAPGKSVINNYNVNSAAYSMVNGNYGLRVDVLDAANNVLATDTYSFNRAGMPAYSVPMFEDMAMMAGIAVDRSMMGAMCTPFPDMMMGGSGAAIADYDGDGLEDIFITDMMGMNHLWRNNGNGTFTDMAMAAGIPMDMESMMISGASFADINNDGFPDLLLLFNDMPNMMLLNDGQGHFTDITATAGITNPVPQNNMSAAWGDYDNDGFLDLYVSVHADCNQTNKNDHLYHNNGNNTFTDATNLLGGSTDPRVNGRGFVAMFIDYNNDGRVDLYVGNDLGNNSFSHPNVLWRNDGPGGPLGWQFTDVSAATGTNIGPSTMGLAWSDYNHSGRYSFLSSNVGSNVLLQQQADGTFKSKGSNVPGGAQLARTTVPNTLSTTQDAFNSVTWSPGFYDFNNDGWEDLFEADGNLDGSMTQYPSGLLMNNGDGTFSDFSLYSGVAGADMSMPTALYADFDQDGFMDIYTEGMMMMPYLFMNMSKSMGNTNHWLEVKLVGTTSNRDAVGARLTATVGTMNLLRTVVNGGNYQGNSTLIQHFGLGTAAQVDKLTVNWPSGKQTVLSNVLGDQRMTIVEP